MRPFVALAILASSVPALADAGSSTDSGTTPSSTSGYSCAAQASVS